MLDQIANEIKTAMKEKQKERLDALRYLKSMLMENKVSKKPKPEMDVVISHFKKLKEAFEAYPEGSDQRAKLEKEMAVVEAFMPKQLSEPEVVELIKNIVSSQENANMGSVMKELFPQIKGKFDGKLANQLVRNVLG